MSPMDFEEFKNVVADLPPMPSKDPAAAGDTTHLASTAATAPDTHKHSQRPSEELADAAAMLRADPEMLARVKAAFEQLEPKMYPHERAGVPVSEHLRGVVKDLVGKPGEGHHRDEPFYLVDAARPIVQMARFKKQLPRVHPYYAVKCNPTKEMLVLLSALGASFDCASLAEIRAVLDAGLATRGATVDIIFANPAKMPHHMEEAEKAGVKMTTFDNEFELAKMARHMPGARAVLRIATDDSAAVCELSSKFGAQMATTQFLLERAKELGVTVIGVSFHVGSGNANPNAFTEAVGNARKVFDDGLALGHPMTLLDIGGGFPGSMPAAGSSAPSFEEICGMLRPELDRHFPAESGVTIIAEPGRFFAESTFSLAVQVQSRRVVEPSTAEDGSFALTGSFTGDGEREFQYYLTDGIYGSFNNVVFDHWTPKFFQLHPDAEAAIRTTTIFGPTCDSLDCIMKQQPFPELEVGDWLFVENFGAYTVAGRSSFNGFWTKRVEVYTSLDIRSLT